MEGGTGKREDATKTQYWVSGIGWDKASSIAYTTLTNYLTPQTDYIDAASFSIIAAQDLYGMGSKEDRMNQMAWYAVGLADLPTVGLQKIALSSTVTLSPNPANEQLQVRFENNSNALRSIEICDVMGQVILQQNIANGSTIDIANLVTGVYFMRFADGTCLKFCKL